MSRYFFIILLLVIISCSSGKDDASPSSSLIDFGDDVEKVTAQSATVLSRFDGWKPGIYHGIDISHYQGDIIARLTDHHDSLHFVICKATQGITYVDPDFRANWRSIKEEGFIRGTYHFYMFADDPKQQAEHFLEQIADIAYSDIAPIVDVEEAGLASNPNASSMQADLKLFLQAIEDKLQRKPIIYCDPSFANTYLNDPHFANYQLWLAEYTRGKPEVPDVWKMKGYLIWQKSANYSVYSTTTDFDLFKGRLNDLIR